MNQYKIIDDVLRNRRKQINLAFEGKDERMMAHLHTFINKFEEELKQKLALNHSQQVVKSGEELKEPSVKDLNRNQHADNSERGRCASSSQSELNKDFCLADKRKEVYLLLRDNFNHIDNNKVEEIINKLFNQDKEFVKRLKDRLIIGEQVSGTQIMEVIDELTGDLR